MFSLELLVFNLNDDAQESRDDLLQIPSTMPNTTTACTS